MSELAPEARVWNLLRGALATRTLALVADLRVPDALAAGPRPVEDLARETGADPDTLHRILRALASDGVFAEEERGVFRNTEASAVLCGDEGWTDFAHLFGGVWYRTLGDLDASSPEPPFPRMFGTDFWSWLADNPSERAAFDRAMSQGNDRRVERLAALDWRGDETVVDVGGGNGSLLLGLLRRQPGLRGVVFDLPETTRDEERSATAAPSWRATSSRTSRPVTSTSSRRSSTTGTTRAPPPSCTRFAPPRPPARGWSSSTRSSCRETSRTARSGSIC
jgi:hypothetical protein